MVFDTTAKIILALTPPDWQKPPGREKSVDAWKCQAMILSRSDRYSNIRRSSLYASQRLS
jgi:hypothetical protein